ncbi:hypothetical protein EBBID32_38220 [Sphingobium indicum BiD32]|uniref:Uncharacterized protein n=1 Tax=Sphingobium indicum BiD32 TaxID=1301087 RepID=N1MR66_9SPHN|nr:hypothetical protein EBBID32_38220 [Sphingobium indicum BiD32]
MSRHLPNHPSNLRRRYDTKPTYDQKRGLNVKSMPLTQVYPFTSAGITVLKKSVPRPSPKNRPREIQRHQLAFISSARYKKIAHMAINIVQK